jgi:hypothetical protein
LLKAHLNDLYWYLNEEYWPGMGPPLIQKDFDKAQFSRPIVDIHILQLERRLSEIRVPTGFLIGSSKVKAWPVIIVSECQKRSEGCSSPGVATKATPTWIKGAALSFHLPSQSMATFCQEEELRYCACNHRSKPDRRFAMNAERATQSGYGRKRRWAPEQSCLRLENPEKGSKGSGLGSESAGRFA